MSALGLFTLLALVAVGSTLILSLRMRGTTARGGPTGDPGCGRCGYPARGLPTFTCPECGSDLREVGIIRHSRGHRRKVLLVGLATLGAVVLAVGVLNLLRRSQIAAVSATRRVQPISVTPTSARRVNPSQLRIQASKGAPTQVIPGGPAIPVDPRGSILDADPSEASSAANDNVDP
ncbi:MAG: hypothetical protein IT449_04265 [Phycisphaerales bacterium]|nr:hypothetical protein [Phycisphaerales bacterium]